MAVMRSVQYVPGNNEKMVAKAPSIPADIITLDLEDSVPPAEKARARDVVAANLESAGSGGAEVYVRINNWETEMTNDDLEAIVLPGLDGVTLAKCGHPDNVQRLDWKLEELEQRRGLAIGSIRVSLLLETAKGIIFAYDSCAASPRVVSAIFGAVDFTKDMRVKLTSKGEEQKYGRRHMAVAARAAGVIAIDAPFVAYQDMEAFEANVRDGRQMGYEGRMIIHPSQVEVCNRLYAPDPADVEWAVGVVEAFETEAIAKGTAAISLNGKMVDTPVYLNAKAILAAQQEIEAKNASAVGS
jgi:citrate lyase subunit beta/citryl-CoA lyase